MRVVCFLPLAPLLSSVWSAAAAGRGGAASRGTAAAGWRGAPLAAPPRPALCPARGAATMATPPPSSFAGGAPTDVLMAYISVPSAAVGTSLAAALVADRHAACVTRLPGAVSTYRWAGAVTTDAEELLLVKTTAARLAGLTTAVVSAHPYDVPEVVAVPVVGGNPAYLSWVRESVADSVEEGGEEKGEEGVGAASAGKESV